jgi:hypothetical protein
VSTFLQLVSQMDINSARGTFYMMQNVTDPLSYQATTDSVEYVNGKFATIGNIFRSILFVAAVGMNVHDHHRLL